jgi:hypothetical protein
LSYGTANTWLSPCKEIITSFHCIVWLHLLGYENTFLLHFIHIFTSRLHYFLENGEKINCSKSVLKYKFDVACKGTTFILNLIRVWPAGHLKRADRHDISYACTEPILIVLTCFENRIDSKSVWGRYSLYLQNY